jgi:hypothetical protein
MRFVFLALALLLFFTWIGAFIVFHVAAAMTPFVAGGIFGELLFAAEDPTVALPSDYRMCVCCRELNLTV